MSVTPASPPLTAGQPDPHGQAALLLVESLIHGLIDNRMLAIGDAVSVIEVARDAQVGLVDAGRSAEAATHLLEAVLVSMETDLPSGDGRDAQRDPRSSDGA